MQTWVFAEEIEGAPTTLALEMLSKARTFGGDLAAVYLGAGSDAAFATPGAHRATKVSHLTPGGGLPTARAGRPPAPGRMPWCGLLRPKSFAAEAGAAFTPEVIPVALPDVGHAGEAAVLEHHAEGSEGPSLEEAASVVTAAPGGGRPHH